MIPNYCLLFIKKQAVLLLTACFYFIFSILSLSSPYSLYSSSKSCSSFLNFSTTFFSILETYSAVKIGKIPPTTNAWKFFFPSCVCQVVSKTTCFFVFKLNNNLVFKWNLKNKEHWPPFLLYNEFTTKVSWHQIFEIILFIGEGTTANLFALINHPYISP